MIYREQSRMGLNGTPIRKPNTGGIGGHRSPVGGTAI